MNGKRTVDVGVSKVNAAGRDAQRDRRDACHTHLAFTLIELLAVIAIIGLLSALVMGLSGIAVEKQREARIRGDHNKILTGIESYKSEMGNYPPDNPNRTTWRDDNKDTYRERCARNALFYELSGAVFSNNTFIVVSKDVSVSSATLSQELGVNGIENSARRKLEIPYHGLNFKLSEFTTMETQSKEPVDILTVPLKGPYEPLKVKGGVSSFNAWFYDASSTNRHNSDTFDLWTEYLAGKRTNVFGNWKE